MKVLKCAGCGIHLGDLADGSRVRKGMACLCPTCEKLRQTWREMASKYGNNEFYDLFKGFNGKGM